MRRRKASFPNGIVLYEGPSALDGSPIVAIVTCLVSPSTNDKTGPMSQLIIMRSDVSPTDAATSGEDKSVCGDCPARKTKKNWCYVAVGRPITTVWRAYKRGVYPAGSTDDLISSRWSFRHGTYGNPSALPFKVNEGIFTALANAGKKWTAYEHEWKTCDQRLSRYSMASCETLAAAKEAISKGWRPYLACLPDEIEQASKELGLVRCPYRRHDASTPQCNDCNMCGGNSSKARPGIVSPVHGSSYKVTNFNKMRASLRVV
jgi:hypothetical protein